MPKKKAEVTDATKRYNAMKMSSGGGPTIERHGMNRALDSTPTAQMRQELAAAGVEVPSDDALCTQKERSESTLMLTATKRPRRRPASP